MKCRQFVTVVAMTCAGWSAMAGWAQAQGPDTVEVDALQCWRRIASHAVHIGERFDMMLTCSVVETDGARAVPDPAWLEPETLAVSPFEVLEGERYRDILRGSRRFFQYRYGLRIIGEDYFGLDVELPALEVKYRIERALDTGAAVEGRELSYILPPESVRVLALVPASAADIRELPGETFGDAEARLFRATAASIAATVLGVLAAGVLLMALVHARREWAGSVKDAAEPVPSWRIARAVRDELAAVRDASVTDGWTSDLMARTLNALRLAAALAVGTPVAQFTAVGTASENDRTHRLRVRAWPVGARAALVSASITPRRLDMVLPTIRDARPDDVPLIESLRDGLAAFTAARYAATPDAATDVLGGGMEAGLEAARMLSWRTLPPVQWVDQTRRSVREWIAARWPH